MSRQEQALGRHTSGSGVPSQHTPAGSGHSPRAAGEHAASLQGSGQHTPLLRAPRKTPRSWQTSFLDVVILLLSFFVILTGLASFDTTDYFDFQRGLGAERPGDRVVHVQTPIDEVRAELEHAFGDILAAGSLRMFADRDELRLEFTDSGFYGSASAELLPEGAERIDRMLQVLTDLEHYDFRLDVEGHTDDRPIQTLQFPSNWELSTARASNIIRYFIDNGFDPQRAKASGYADTQPLLPNRDATGEPIEEHMDLNRRVVVRIYY